MASRSKEVVSRRTHGKFRVYSPEGSYDRARLPSALSAALRCGLLRPTMNATGDLAATATQGREARIVARRQRIEARIGAKAEGDGAAPPVPFVC